jgi:hypothetical protein
MSWNGAANHREYSRWVNNIARNMRITGPEAGLYLDFIRYFLKVMWNPVTQTGTRPWLDNKFRRLAVSGVTNYKCDIDVEPVHVLVEMLTVVGRDFKKIPITDFEKTGADLLINMCENRHLGTGPYFGGVSGNGAASVPDQDPD